MKLRLYMSSKQIDYHQQLEIMMVMLKNAFGDTETPKEADIINDKIKSLPVMNDKASVAAFFQRNN